MAKAGADKSVISFFPFSLAASVEHRRDMVDVDALSGDAQFCVENGDRNRAEAADDPLDGRGDGQRKYRTARELRQNDNELTEERS